jgi:hypothetical protein
MSIKMAVSKASFDVLTTSNQNLIFSSDLATHSIYSIVPLTITSPDTAGTITHNLGYAPKVWAMGSATSNTWYRIPYLSPGVQQIDYYIDTANVVIEAPAFTSPLNLKVIIFTRTFIP